MDSDPALVLLGGRLLVFGALLAVVAIGVAARRLCARRRHAERPRFSEAT